jgi:hypothetical protein
MLADHVTESWTPPSEAEKAAVREQLERLLLNSHFSSSKRYPSFLRFVLTHSLAGEMDLLKERTLGIEVFGRTPDYDTATDPIVRVTAAEIRKRIEQYYHEPGHDNEVRLFLPSGSYALQFYPPGHSAATGVAESSHTSVAEPLAPPVELAQARSLLFSSKTLVALILVLFLGAASALLWRTLRPSAAQVFWEPFVKSNEPVLFCIADQSQYSTITQRDAADPARKITLNDNLVAIVIDDVSPLIGIAGILENSGRTYRVQGESTTSLTDLRRGPSVLIGAYDNGWTLRLTSPLRFHFANNPEMTRYWVEDRVRPDSRDWLLERSQQLQTGTYKDYAIVARFVDPNTDRFVMIVAGIARGGTVAAGEFLVDARYLDQMARRVPANWNRRNIEIVLETQVIDGRSGPPRIAAVHVW